VVQILQDLVKILQNRWILSSATAINSSCILIDRSTIPFGSCVFLDYGGHVRHRCGSKAQEEFCCGSISSLCSTDGDLSWKRIHRGYSTRGI